MSHTHHAPMASAIAGHPIHSVVAQFPIVCFTLTLLTDIAYWRTANLMWLNFSSWLLFAGLVGGALTAVAGIIDFVFRPSVRSARPAWPQALGSLVVFGLAFLNSLVHAGDGWTAVVPWGIALSVLTVLVISVSSWLGWTDTRHRGQRS